MQLIAFESSQRFQLIKVLITHIIYLCNRMKANVILLLGVLFAQVFITNQLSYQHYAEAAAPAPTAPASNASTAPNASAASNNTKAAAPASPGVATVATPPPPPAVKLCSFNKLGAVAASPNHKFSVTNIKASNYENKDFDVTWKEARVKKHKFFQFVSKNANFAKAFPKLKCQFTDKKTFGTICNIKNQELNQRYSNAFGQDIIFKCEVPKGSFVLNLRFVPQISDFKTDAAGRWSVFGGVYEFKTQAEATKLVQDTVKKINEEIKSSKLNTLQVNSHLNINPDEVKKSLAKIFNSNLNNPFVKSVEKGKQYDLVDVGYVKILPPGTPFIIGSINKGTNIIKNICDNYHFDAVKGDCGVKI